MSNNKDTNIGIAITTLDAEATLKRALDSVCRAFENVVVCDRGSRDNTVALARKAGAKVIRCDLPPYNGLADARQAALKELQTPWVMFVRQDEMLPTDVSDHVRRWVTNCGEYTGLSMPRRTYVTQKLILGLYPDYQLRLVKREHATLLDNGTLLVEGESAKVPARKRHLALIRLANEIPGARMPQVDADAIEAINVYHVLWLPVRSFCDLYFRQGFWKYGMVGYMQAIRAVNHAYEAIINRYEAIQNDKLQKIIDARTAAVRERHEREAQRENRILQHEETPSA